MSAELVTEWSSSDPRLAAMLRSIAELPEWSEERLAAEAALHTFQAQLAHERIGRIRLERAQAERNRRAARARKPDK